MWITDLLKPESIELHGNVTSKREAIDQLVDLMDKSGNILDKEAYKDYVLKREKEGTTGVGEGIAIPHGRGKAVKTAGLSAMVIPKGVDYESLDGQSANLIFMIAAPDTAENVHLEVLSHLSMLLMDREWADSLRRAKNNKEFLECIYLAERKKFVVEEEERMEEGKKFLAVTACPTGIAHTYMAAEALEKKAKEKGHEIKVETRGSGGAKNVLTKEEIAAADCIIVCADTNIAMERFEGKRVIIRQVSDGISKAEELIDLAASGKVELYHSEKKFVEKESSTPVKESTGHAIYKHLMNGVSHMLPFVVGGGILIAIAFLIDGMSVDLASLAAEERGNFGSITPLAALFKGIGGTAFGFMLPILAGFIAMSIADRPGMALGFVGGAIAASGKSGFLGALIAGFLAGYVIIGLRKLFDNLPESLEGIKPVMLYPLIGIFVIGMAMTFLVEPPVGAWNTLLNNGLNSMSGTSGILLGCLLAGMMSVDLGGPINKAAYVFGVASIAAGNYTVMAAVMVGGMVPPCAIALATILFKKKFTLEERKSGPTNFIMGLSFISEGAIPYAAADPIHVLPSLIIGSAVSGALSMAFGCTLMAPHGGIFVFPVVGHAVMYLVSLTVGTVVGAVMLGLIKKNVEE